FLSCFLSACLSRSALYPLSLHDALPIFRANTHLTEDVTQAIAAAREAEDWPAAREILDRILENDAIGGGTPICQDTGMACVFLEDRKSTRLNSSHVSISYAVFCLKKKKQ